MQPLEQRPELAKILQALNVFFANRLALVSLSLRHPPNMRDQKSVAQVKIGKRKCRAEQAWYKVALFARLEAKPGKENEVAKLLETGLELAKQEPKTRLWFALRLGPTTFGVFDAFNDEDGRQTHLNGPIAKALVAKTPELFTKPPSIEPLEVLGVKQAA